MPRLTPLQTNFASGELAPGLHMRLDTQQYRDGAKSLRNYRCLLEGGATRRPGSYWRHDLVGNSRLAEWVVDSTTKYVVAFSEGRADFFLESGGSLTASGSLTSSIWTGGSWATMDIAQSANTMFLTHSGFWPQVLVRTSTNTWTQGNVAFFSGIGGRTHQPYYKMVDETITLQPSATTGSVTLTTSGTVFDEDHVGLKFRYLGKEVLITAVTDGDTATATVIEELPPTQNLTVTAATGSFIGSGSFNIGDVVTGATSGAKGEVTAVVGTTVQVAIIEGLTKFGTSEEIIGPNGRAQTTAAADVTPLAAVKAWDEQLFSAVRGYPLAVALHRNRLLFAGHAFVPSALVGSTPTNLYDFDVGEAADGDGLFETIGDAAASTIVKLYSTEQLLVLTDGGAYYVPETRANPFRPSAIEFNKFGDAWPFTTRVRPVPMDGGVIMISGSLVIKAKPTGNQQAMWEAEPISLLASHMITSPVDLAVCANFNGGPEAYAIIINSDGTLAVMQSVDAHKLRNFTPWDTTGGYLSVVAMSGTIYAAVTRTINGVAKFLLEQFEQDITLDAAKSYADAAALAAGGTGVVAIYGSGNAKVVVTGSTYHLDTYPFSFVGDPPAGPYTVGLDYTTELETLPPIVEDSRGHKTATLQRILSADIHVRSSARFAAQGYELHAYQTTDALDEAPPEKNGSQHFGFLGWAKAPTLVITQVDPLPLTIDAIQMEVAA